MIGTDIACILSIGPYFQDGNTPYSLALSGGNMETANFVMTYASKSPQRDSGGPVRIFNMQVGG